MPRQHFTAIQQKSETIVYDLDTMIKAVKKVNPKMQFILTISPVRCISEGLINNTLNKSTPQLTTQELVKLHSDCVAYFPSFEIMIDELRDYRFYEQDKIHPSKKAIDYVWNWLNDVGFDKELLKYIQKIEELIKAKNHCLRYPNTSKSQFF